MKNYIPIRKTDENGYCIFFERGSGTFYGAYLGRQEAKRAALVFPLAAAGSGLQAQISAQVGEFGFFLLMEATALLAAVAVGIYLRRRVQKLNFFELYRFDAEDLYRSGCLYFDMLMKILAGFAAVAAVLFYFAQSGIALAWILHWLAVWVAALLWYCTSPAAVYRRLKQLAADIGKEAV